MDKKKNLKILPSEDLKGFEEFIEGQPQESSFMNKGVAPKKEVSFEHFTFLTNDSERLLKLKNLLTQKLPFSTKFEQGKTLLNEQREEIVFIKVMLFEIANKPNSAYRKSLGEVFDSFFEPPKV